MIQRLTSCTVLDRTAFHDRETGAGDKDGTGMGVRDTLKTSIVLRDLMTILASIDDLLGAFAQTGGPLMRMTLSIVCLRDFLTRGARIACK